MNNDATASADPENSSHPLAANSSVQLPHESAVPPRAKSGVLPNRILDLIQLDQRQVDRIIRTVPGGSENVQDIYPLAPLQEGMLFHYLLNRNSDSYILATFFHLKSESEVEKLIEALQTVMDRHDILRSAILWEQLPRPVQVVCRRAALPVGEFALDGNRDVLAQLEEQTIPGRQVFDLSYAPLVRLQVAAGPAGSGWYGVLHVHHLVCDHQSLQSVVAEAIACAEGHVRELPLPGAYREYIAEVLADAKVNDSGAFFKAKLKGVDGPTAPFGLMDVHGDDGCTKEARETVDPTLVKATRIQARRFGVTPARLFHAAWGLVLAVTCGRTDVVFGTVLLSSRHRRANAQHVLGLSVNTLPLRLRLDGVTAEELLNQTHDELTELLRHENAPLTLAQRSSDMVGTAPLFTSIFNYRRSIPEAEMHVAEVTGIRVLGRHEATTNYPVTLTVDDFGEELVLTAHTNRRVDPNRVTQYMHGAVRSLVGALESAPQTLALSLCILPESERKQVIELFDDTYAEYPDRRLVFEIFEEYAKNSPDAPALECDGNLLTYSELNGRANQLAHYLRSKGACPDQLIGIYMERSFEMMVALLATLKAGAAYLPLDPNYPPERLRHMLADASPRMLLVYGRLEVTLPAHTAEVVSLDTDWDQIERYPTSNPEARRSGLQPGHLAYVIYTSGSTGQPKGVMIEHHSLANLVRWHCSAFGLTEGHRSCSVAGLSFDATTWEIWPPLVVGGTLILATTRVTSDPESLLMWWSRETLNSSFLPTPLAELAFTQGLRNAGLRTLLVGGDRLRRTPPEGSEFTLVNNYGPTECTVVATSGCVQDEDDVLHIGKPISNTRVYILTRHLQPAPIGIAGEIYIGGVGVARGYLHRPELTAERFLADPFGSVPHARMYASGDMGRWRSDGTIEYVGRNDHQLKIRGYRIEPGEIESRLNEHPRVKEAVVIARDQVSGEKCLVAYITSRGPEAFSVDELRAYLQHQLPRYMVPSAFVALDSLPLTLNGKLNRDALPAPDSTAYSGREYQPPEGEIEVGIAQIWQELLGAEWPGRKDDFFELGGHSLLAIKLISSLADRFAVQMPVRAVFKYPTIQEMAQLVSWLLAEREPSAVSSQAGLEQMVI